MSGAVQSGYRAAAEILQDLQSTALKAEDLSLIEKAHPMASSWEEHLLTTFSIQNFIKNGFQRFEIKTRSCLYRTIITVKFTSQIYQYLSWMKIQAVLSFYYNFF